MKDVGFAFNDKDFSDRLLYVEIVAESLSSGSDSNTEDRGKKLNKAKGNDVHDKDSKCSAVVEVECLHINSVILAADSPFFFKLFKNGMRESIEKHVTMQICASEEVAFMDLLGFMYKNTLTATSAPDLLNVLMIADKFEVTSCVRYCCKLLQSTPLSLESAILYLDLPLFMGEVELLPLKDAAKHYLNYNFSFSSSKIEKLMDLPLSALEVFLAIDGLRVDSEQDVYEFILQWARTHYPNLEERREILTKRLAQFIYFPFLCMSTLKEIQVCPDFDSKELKNLVFESLYLNMGLKFWGYHEQLCLLANPTTTKSLKREYEYFPVKAFEIESPKPHCVVYFSLTEVKCRVIVVNRTSLRSQRFRVGKEWFVLYASNCKNAGGKMEHLCLSVSMHNHQTCPINIEFAVMGPKSLHEFQVMDNHVNDKTKMFECRIPIPSDALIGNGSRNSMNNMLHIRAKISAENSQDYSHVGCNVS